MKNDTFKESARRRLYARWFARFLVGLLVCLGVGWAQAQPITPPVKATPYTRGMLTNSTAVDARAYLGISGGVLLAQNATNDLPYVYSAETGLWYALNAVTNLDGTVGLALGQTGVGSTNWDDATVMQLASAASLTNAAGWLAWADGIWDAGTNRIASGGFIGDGSGLTNVGGATLQGVEIIGIGDSTMFRGYGLWPAGVATNQGPEWSAVNQGVDGNLVSDVLARMQKDVITPGSDYLLVQVGINSIRTGVPDGTVQSQLQSIYNWAFTNGIPPIAVNLAPFGGHVEYTSAIQASISNVNWWISNAATNLYAVADAYTWLGDPAAPTNLLADFDAGDHVHFSTNGYIALVSNFVANVTLTNNGTDYKVTVRGETPKLDQPLRRRDVATFAGAAFRLSNGALLQFTNAGTGGAMVQGSGALNYYPGTGIHVFWDGGALVADHGLTVADQWSFTRQINSTNLVVATGGGNWMELTNAGSAGGKLRASGALNLDSKTGQFYFLSNNVNLLDYNLTTAGTFSFHRPIAGDGNLLTNLPASASYTNNATRVGLVTGLGVGTNLVNLTLSNATMTGTVTLNNAAAINNGGATKTIPDGVYTAVATIACPTNSRTAVFLDFAINSSSTDPTNNATSVGRIVVQVAGGVGGTVASYNEFAGVYNSTVGNYDGVSNPIALAPGWALTNSASGTTLYTTYSFAGLADAMTNHTMHVLNVQNLSTNTVTLFP